MAEIPIRPEGHEDGEGAPFAGAGSERRAAYALIGFVAGLVPPGMIWALSGSIGPMAVAIGLSILLSTVVVAAAAVLLWLFHPAGTALGRAFSSGFLFGLPAVISTVAAA